MEKKVYVVPNPITPGQVIFITKLLKNKDMAFYAGINLNKKNKN